MVQVVGEEKSFRNYDEELEYQQYPTDTANIYML